MRNLKMYVLSAVMILSSVLNPVSTLYAEDTEIEQGDGQSTQDVYSEDEYSESDTENQEPTSFESEDTDADIVVTDEIPVSEEEDTEIPVEEPDVTETYDIPVEPQEVPETNEYNYEFLVRDEEQEPDDNNEYPVVYTIRFFGEEGTFIPETSPEVKEIKEPEETLLGEMKKQNLRPSFGLDISLGEIKDEEKGQDEKPEKIEPNAPVKVVIQSDSFPENINDLKLLHFIEKEEELKQEQTASDDSNESADAGSEADISKTENAVVEAIDEAANKGSVINEETTEVVEEEAVEITFEEIEFTFNEEENEIEFTVDSFSPFIFAEEIPEEELKQEQAAAEQEETEKIVQNAKKKLGAPLKAPATNTEDIFGILYEDGDLVFQKGNETDDSKGEVLETFADFDGTDYHPWTASSNKNLIRNIIYTEDVNVTNLSQYFTSLTNLVSVTGLDHLKVSNTATSAYHMFYGCNNLQSVDLTGLDLSSIGSAEGMFYYCYSLESANIEDTGMGSIKPVNCNYIFRYCDAIKFVNFSNMHISNMTSAMDDADGLQIAYFINTDFGSSCRLYELFEGDHKLAIADFTGATGKITDFSYAFNGTSKIGRLDLSGLDLTSNSGPYSSFSGCNFTEIKLGENWRFRDTGMKLPAGNWMRKSTGETYTADELYSMWNSDMADTYSKVNVVSFDGNSGNASKKKAICNFGEPLEELPTATKDGYAFLGWFTLPNGGTQLNEGDPIEQSTYYAHWAENNYTLILKRNVEDDPDDTEERIELGYTEIYNLSDSIFTNDDKVLQGWMTSAESSSIKYGPNEPVVMLAAEPGGVVTLYAKWGRTRNATVTLEEEGGSDVENIIIERGQSLNSRMYQIPVREGYSFKGWFTEPEGKGTRYDNTNRVIERDITLYAYWVKDPVVSFNPNGGWVETFTRTVPYGEAIGSLPKADARPEKLIGYFTSQEPGEGEKLTSSKKFYEDATYYAHWGYQPTFNTNGGKFTGSFNLNTVYPVDYPRERVISTLPSVERDGYVLDHWELADHTVVNAGDTVDLHDFPEIIAVWEKADAVTITFDPDGGALPTGQTTVYEAKKGEPIGYLPNPSKNINGRRAEFLGWYDENDELVTSDKIAETDMTLTAKWGEKKYKLTFVPRGGADVASYNSSGLNTRWLAEGEPLGIVPGSKADGYYLEGWYPDPECQGEKLTADTTVTENTTWYANWINNREDKVSDEVAYRYWAEWSNASNDNVDNLNNNLNFHPTSNNSQTASLHLHFELNSQVSSVLPQGAVRIRIPKSVWKNWEGNDTGTNNLSSQMAVYPKKMSGMWFSYYEDGDDYVLTNNQPLAGGAGVDMTISYNVTPMNVPGGAIDSNGDYVDGYDFYSGNVPVTFTIDKNFEATSDNVQDLDYDPQTTEERNLTLEMHTKIPHLISKKFYKLHYEWNSTWGPKPADADDYFYIEWETRFETGSASQPGSFEVSENTVHDGTVVYGGSTNYSMSPRTNTSGYLYSVTKHPKSLVENIPSTGITFRNQSERTDTWKSGYKETIVSDASYTINKWEYTVGEFDKTNTYGGQVEPVKGGQEIVLDDRDVLMDWELHYDGVSRDTPLIWHEDTRTYEAQQRIISISDGINGDLFYSSGRSSSKYVWEPGTGNYTLTDDDYTINSLKVYLQEYDGTYYNNEWGGPMSNNESSKWKDFDVYLRYKDTDELVFWRSFSSTGLSKGTCREIQLPPNVNGYEIRYPTSYYRTFLQVYMYTSLHPTANIKSFVYDDTMREVTSIIKNRGYCNIWTADNPYDDPDTFELRTDLKSWTKDNNPGHDIFFHVTDWTGGSNGANKECYELDKSKVSLYTQKCSSKQGNVVFDVERGYQENPMSIAGWNYTSSGNTKYTKNGIFYDLLPRGATVPEESIFAILDVYNSTDRSHNYADDYAEKAAQTSSHLAREFYNVEFIENWENSGRTMMVIRYMVPENRKCNRAMFFYKLRMTYADIVNYGTSVENDVAYIDDSVRDYDYYSSQNPATVITEREYYELLDAENDWVAHYAADTNYIPVDAFSWGFDKTVKTKNEYVNDDITIPNNVYTYKLNFSQSDYAISDSIVFFDVMETGAYDNDGQLETPSEWYGYFESIDVSSIREKLKFDTTDVYCDPIVYYSTKPKDQFTGADYVISNTDTWTTEMPANKEDITAVAVDCTHATDGSDFIYKGRMSMAVYITMRAPDDTAYVGKSAVNQAKLISRVYENERPENPTETTSDTTVTIENEEPEVHKTSDPETGTEEAPKIVGYGDDLTYTLTVTNKNATFTVPDFVLEDPIPEGVQVKTNEIKVHFGNPQNAASISVSPRVDMKQKDGKLIFNINSLMPGETAYIIVPTRVIANGNDEPIRNQAKLISVNGVDKDIDTETTWHEVQYDVIFSKQSDLKQLVVGAELELYDTDTNELIERWTSTKANKKIRLYIGHFKLVEVSAPDGYARADDLLFEVQPDGSILYTDGTTDSKVTMIDVASTTVEGKKEWKWDDVSNRPESITVNLLRNGQPYMSKVVTAADNWEYNFGQVPKYDSSRQPYTYTISEDAVPNYIAAYSSEKKTNGVELIFSNKTSMADTSDYFEIYYDYEGKMFTAGHYTKGNDFSDLHVQLPTDNFYIYWHSNGGGNDYGFRIEQIKPIEFTDRVGSRKDMPTGFIAEEVTGNKYPETDHGYFINEDILWHYTAGMEGDILGIVNTLDTEALDIEIDKVGENNEHVAGVTLRVTGNPGIGDFTIDPIEWVTDGTPKILKLQPGNYLLHEVAAAAGYQFADDIPFRVNQDGKVLYGDDLTAVMREEVENKVKELIGGTPSTEAKDNATWLDKVTMLDKNILQPFPFSKNWMDTGYEDERPENVEFKLYRRSSDGSEDEHVATATLSSENAISDYVWEGEFEDVPVVDENWEPYSYYITETVNGNEYRVFYDVQDRTGFLVKFTDDSDIGHSKLYINLMSPTSAEHMSGYWTDTYLALNEKYDMAYLEGTDMVGKYFYVPATYDDSFGFTLNKANDFVHLEIEEIVPTNQAQPYTTRPCSTGIFAGPKYTGAAYPDFDEGSNNTQYLYQWLPTEVSQMMVPGSEIVNYPNKTKLIFKKLWDDAGHKDERPETLTFDVYNINDMDTPVDTKTFDVTDGDEATYFFDDLPKFNDDKTEAVYIIREHDTEKYHEEHSISKPKGFLVTFSDDTDLKNGYLSVYPAKSTNIANTPAYLYGQGEAVSARTSVSGTEAAGKTYFIPVLDENDPGFALSVSRNSMHPDDSVYVKVTNVVPVAYINDATTFYNGMPIEYGFGEVYEGKSYPEFSGTIADSNSRYALYKYSPDARVTNRYDVTELPFEKKWANDVGFEEYRPQTLTVGAYNVRDLETPVNTITISAANAKAGNANIWKGTITNLPKYNEDGTEARYVAKEATVPNCYEQKQATQNIKGFMLKFADDCQLDSSSAYIMQSTGTGPRNYICSSGNSSYWSSSSTSLAGRTVYIPVLTPGVNEFYFLIYRNSNKALSVNIEEIYPVFEDYNVSVSSANPSVNTTAVVTNKSSYSFTVPTNTSSYAFKYVFDADVDFEGLTNTLKKWPVPINKYSNAWDYLPGATLQVIKASDGTTIVDEWLTQYNEDHTVNVPAGSYILHEKSPAPGFDTAEDIPFTVSANGTITVNGSTASRVRMFDQEFIDIKGTKNWSGDNASLRPASITVNLYRNNTLIDSQVVTAANGWKYEFKNLPKYVDQSATRYNYRVDEDAVIDYRKTIGAIENRDSWVYDYQPGVPGLKVQLNSSAMTESTSFDYFYIYYRDPATNEVRYFTDRKGGSLSNAIYYIPGNEFWFRWQTDGSVQYYGWDIVSVTPTKISGILPANSLASSSWQSGFSLREYTGTNYPRTNHNYTYNGKTNCYGNSERINYHYTYTGTMPSSEDIPVEEITNKYSSSGIQNITNTRLPDKIDVEIQKKTDSGTNVAGAVLEITGHEDNASYDITPIRITTTNQPQTVKLRQGSYTMTEITVPRGYLRAAPVQFSINSNNKVVIDGTVQETNAVPMIDVPNKQNYPFTKTWDDAGYTNYRPASVKFTLYNVRDMETPVKEVTLTSANAADASTWNGVFEDVPLVNEDDETPAVYKIVEATVPYYDATYYGTTPGTTEAIPQMTMTPRYGMKVTMASNCYTNGPLLLVWKDRINGFWYGSTYGVGSNSVINLNATELYMLYRSYGYRAGILVDSAVPLGTAENPYPSTLTFGSSAISTETEPYAAIQDLIDKCNYRSYFVADSFTLDDFVLGNAGYTQSVENEDYNARPVYQLVKLTVPTNASPVISPGMSAEEIASAEGFKITFADDMFTRRNGPIFVVWKDEETGKYRFNASRYFNARDELYIKSHEFYLMYRDVGGPVPTNGGGNVGATELIAQKVEPASNASWITPSSDGSYDSLQDLIDSTQINQYWDPQSADTQVIDARFGTNAVPYTTQYMPSIIYSFNYAVGEDADTEGAEPQAYATGLKNTFVPRTADVPFNKVDEEGNRIANATLQLFNSSDEKLDEWVSSATEAHVVTLGEGTYRLHEASTPSGYVTAQDVTFVVTPIGEIKIGSTVLTSISMTDADTKITFKKTDITTGEKVADAKMAVYLASDMEGNAPKAGAQPVCTWTTSAETDHVLGQILLENTDYVLVETEAPAGYIVAAPVPFHVNGDGQMQTVEMKEDYIKVSIQKKDDLDAFVSGAVMQILSADGKTVIKEWTTDGAAKRFDRLPAGDYILHEVSAPNTHNRAADIEFTVQATGSVQTFTMTDTIKAQLPTGLFFSKWHGLAVIAASLIGVVYILIRRKRKSK